MKQIFSAFLLLMAATEARAAIVGLNDISILLPLPDSPSNGGLLTPEDAGSYGSLIPTSLYPLLTNVDVRDSPASVDFTSLRVVGVRVDPCFPYLDFQNSSSCQAQIRLVWQEIEPTATPNQTTTFDVAVHTFYNIDQGEISPLVHEIQSLDQMAGVDTSALPLGINPVILSQGLQGQYWQDIRSQLLNLIGEKRMSRITFMQSIPGFNIWLFKGYDIVNGQPQDLMVPETDGNSQTIQTNIGGGFFIEEATPAPNGPASFNDLLMNSNQFIANNANNPQALQTTFNSISRIENPNFNNSTTTDCISCHLAQSARLLLTSHFPGLGSLPNQNIFSSSYDLTNNYNGVSANGNELRAFGYFNANAAISQRTINETAAIAEYLSSTLAGQ